MGARGKKRRRDSGSIASGKQPTFGDATPNPFPRIRAVNPDRLLIALRELDKFIPIDPRMKSDDDLGEWDWEDAFDALDTLSASQGWSAEERAAIGVRAEELREFLRTDAGASYFHGTEEGIIVNADLLELAANQAMTDRAHSVDWNAATSALANI